MGLMRTCKACGKTKKLRGNFKLDRDGKVYSDVCKECSSYDLRIRELSEKNNLKTYVLRSWKKLCPLISEPELDQLLFKLKQTYKEINHVD